MGIQYRVSPETSGISDETLRRLNKERWGSFILTTLGLAVFVGLVVQEYYWIAAATLAVFWITDWFVHSRWGPALLKRTPCPQCGHPVGATDYNAGFILDCASCKVRTETGCGYRHLGGPIIRYQDWPQPDIADTAQNDSNLEA